MSLLGHPTRDYNIKPSFIVDGPKVLRTHSIETHAKNVVVWSGGTLIAPELIDAECVRIFRGAKLIAPKLKRIGDYIKHESGVLVSNQVYLQIGNNS